MTRRPDAGVNLGHRVPLDHLFAPTVALDLLQSYIFSVKLFGVWLLLLGSLLAQTKSTGPDQGFDNPGRKTVLDFGPSPHYRPPQHVRKTLTCYFYSAFTVKQYDEGQKGSEWLSIVPSVPATCTRTHSKDEIVLTWREWGGYFWGAKGAYAIFVAPDGTDGGLPFAIFDVLTGRRLFEDAVPLDYYLKKLRIENEFHISIADEQIPRLTYVRVVRAGCNLYKARADCWKKVRDEFGIAQTAIPVCSESENADGESTVAYRVSVLLTDSPERKTIEGPVYCWPTD